MKSNPQLLRPSQPPLETALLLNALSASRSGHALDSMLAQAINTPNTTIYDRAIDSVYLTAGTGGSHLHHLLDGQHDLVGAFAAARAAAPHDSLGSVVFGTAHHLAKDLFSVMGLPVVSLNPETYRQSSTWMQQHLGLAKSWQADLLQINGMELLGGGLAAAVVVLGARRQDAQALFEVAGSSGLAGVLAANPLALIAGTVALILAWQMRKEGQTWTPHWQRAGIGLASSGTAIALGSLLGGFASGGLMPLVLSLVLSLAAGLTVRQWLLSRSASPGFEQPEEQGVDKATQLWQRQVRSMSQRVWSQADEPLLAVLRKAFA